MPLFSHMYQHFHLPLEQPAGYPANSMQSILQTWAPPWGMAFSSCSLSEVAAVLSLLQDGWAKVMPLSFTPVKLQLPHAHIQVSRVNPWKINHRFLKGFTLDPKILLPYRYCHRNPKTHMAQHWTQPQCCTYNYHVHRYGDVGHSCPQGHNYFLRALFCYS